MWVPLETAGIVLVVLVFVLLEREAVRDRFIRIAGGTDLRATTFALNDAGERLSRFFVSQFAVNLGVGAALWIGLALIGLPHAMLWAALAAVLRFVPYVGVWIAALLSTRACGGRRSGMVAGSRHIGLVRDRRADRRAARRTRAVWTYHGNVAFVGGRCGDILELAVGSGRARPVDSFDPMFGGRGTSHQGAESSGYHARGHSSADHAATVLSARALRGFRRDHRQRAGFSQAQFVRRVLRPRLDARAALGRPRSPSRAPSATSSRSRFATPLSRSSRQSAAASAQVLAAPQAAYRYSISRPPGGSCGSSESSCSAAGRVR